MSHRIDAKSFASFLIATLAVTLTMTGAAGKQKSAAARRKNVATPSAVAPKKSDPAPADIAPKTPAAKTYDLRYKLKRGEVLRYDVTHRASVRSTIEQQTQAAQTRTDSVKIWKVTDVLKNGETEIMTVVERV